MAKTVLIVNNVWLGESQSFVAHHALGLRQWSPCALALKAASGGIITQIPVKIVGDNLAAVKLALLGRGTASRFVDKHQPALAHVHFLTAAVAFLPFLRRQHLPFVVTAHGYDATAETFARADMRWAMRFRLQAVFGEATRILCVSDYIRRRVIEKGCPSDKAQTHYLGIPVPELLNIERDELRILFVGRMVPKKGILDLVRAVGMVRAAGIPATLRAVGEGPQRAEAEQLSHALGVPAEWLGAQPYERVLREMQGAAVFCMPSTRAPDGDNEGFGLVYLEAQAMETPVVAYDQGPVPEAVADGETGLLASNGDTAGLAAHLVTLLGSAELRHRMGRGGRQRVIRDFDASRQTRRLETLYDSFT